MKPETINSDYEAQLMSLRELQSQMGDELDVLSLSPSGASGILSALRPSGGVFKPLQGATRGEL